MRVSGENPATKKRVPLPTGQCQQYFVSENTCYRLYTGQDARYRHRMAIARSADEDTPGLRDSRGVLAQSSRKKKRRSYIRRRKGQETGGGGGSRVCEDEIIRRRLQQALQCFGQYKMDSLTLRRFPCG